MKEDMKSVTQTNAAVNVPLRKHQVSEVGNNSYQYEQHKGV